MKNVFMLELRQMLRRKQELTNPLLFFVILCALFPLAISPDKMQLQQIAAGVIWIAAMLSTLLSLDLLFKQDFADGTLEQWMFSDKPLYQLVLVKLFSYWLVTGLPLVLIAPLLALLLNLPQHAVPMMLLTLVVGTPTLTLLGSIAAALSAGMKKSTLIISMLSLPIMMPVLIFGSTTIAAAVAENTYNAPFSWLCVLLALSLTLAPFATAAGLRISISTR